MNTLSTNSQKNLASCHPVLVDVVGDALCFVNVGVTCGERGELAQNKLFFSAKSQLKFPHSSHNKSPSEGVDLVIYHPKYKYLWGSRELFKLVAEDNECSVAMATQWFYMQYARLDTILQLSAQVKGYKLRWGGKWDNPEDLLGNTLIDVYHWELGEKL